MAIKILFWFIVFPACTCAQQFKRIPIEMIAQSSGKKIVFRDIITTAKGDMLIATSFGIAEINGGKFTMDFARGIVEKEDGSPQHWKSSNIFKDVYELRAGFKTMALGPDDMIYVVSDNNNLGLINYKIGKGITYPPYNFPNNIDIWKIWIDKEGDLFIATTDSFYIVYDATTIFDKKTKKLLFKTELNKDSNIVVTEGAKKIKGFSLGKNVLPYCFAEEHVEDNIFIGTNQGIYEFEKKTGLFFNLFKEYRHNPVTITHIEISGMSSDIWFSTLESGMGNYSQFSKTVTCYPYKKDAQQKNPVENFTILSNKEFLVAIADSLPAIFNKENASYQFIEDTSFNSSKNNTTDVQIGAGKHTALIKAGELYVSSDFPKDQQANNLGYYIGPYIKEILIGGISYKDKGEYFERYDSLKTINLNYYENNIDILYAPRGTASSDTLIFAWMLEGKWDQWTEEQFTLLDDRMNMAMFHDLKPGKYIFRVKMKKGKGNWLKEELKLTIIIDPPFWKTWWFWLWVITGIFIITYIIVKLRVKAVRKQERERARHEKELSELEAKALRAQMNPHFIFNCLNSIKSLIQQHDEEKSVTYLTIFSKLIRTLVNNADKKEISLYDEIETCKLYLQLEAMRFDASFSYSVNVDPDFDLKSIQVPALIIQPFIENAIWHGIVPKGNKGKVALAVIRSGNHIEISIDDNGIGRDSSQQNKSVSGIMHQSKGVNLTQSRLELDNHLRQRHAKLETVDKKDGNGVAIGTKVIITINEESV